MCKEKCNEKSIDRRFHVNNLVNLIANGVELIWNKIHEMDGDCERKVEIYFCLECVCAAYCKGIFIEAYVLPVSCF